MAGWDRWLSPSSDMCTLSSDRLCETQWQGAVCGLQDGARAHAHEAPTQARQGSPVSEEKVWPAQPEGPWAADWPVLTEWKVPPTCHGHVGTAAHLPHLGLLQMRPGTFRSALWPTDCHCRGCRWVGSQGRAWPTLMVCVYSKTVVCMCQGGKTPQPGLWSHESQCWDRPSTGLQDVPDVTIPRQTLRLLSETLAGAEVVVSLSHRRRLSPG